MKTVLIVDATDYRNVIEKLLLGNGYDVISSDSAFDAMGKLKTFDIDLVVSQVSLPGDNAFDLYNYLTSHYTFIPTVMITHKDIDTFFDRIFTEGIGNVLPAPVDEHEFMNLVDKLIRKNNIFGLNNYLEGITDTRRIRIQSSRQIQKAIDMALKKIEEWGFHIYNRMVVMLVLNEMAINAVYHSHGYTREKEARIQVTLDDDEYVDIYIARNAESYGIAINDYKGKLTKEKILESIQNMIEQEQIILRAAETGEDISEFISETGRGIDLVRKLTGEYYFIIKRDVRTEIILLFTPRNQGDQPPLTSLKIIEDRREE